MPNLGRWGASFLAYMLTLRPCLGARRGALAGTGTQEEQRVLSRRHGSASQAGTDFQDEDGLAFEENATWPPKGKTATEMAVIAVKRACVDEWGEHAEELFRTELQPIFASSPVAAAVPEEDQLPALLAARWDFEDLLSSCAKGKRPEVQRDLDKAKADIKQRFFSVDSANKLCGVAWKFPRPEAVRDCVIEHIRERKTMRRFHRERRLEELTDGDIETLERLVHERWALKTPVRVLADVLSHLDPPEKLQVKALLKTKTAAFKAVDKQITDMKFSFHHTKKHCKTRKGGDNLYRSTTVISRITQEVNGVVTEEGRECMEKEGESCPEGTSPDSRRDFDPKTFAAAYAVSAAVTKPIIMGVGFVVGFLTAGPPGGAAGLAATSVPGPGLALSIPIAAAAATDWFPQCRCYPNPCAYDANAGTCSMALSEKSSNPFQHLPYPGQKCALVAGQEACELQPCADHDYENALGNRWVHGTVGLQIMDEYTAIHNCLSTSTSADESFMLSDEIPDGAGGIVSNTVPNRINVYRMLDVPPPSHH